jgi:hypothetical protein
MFFYAVNRVTQSVPGFKSILVLVDLVTIGLTAAALRAVDQPAERYVAISSDSSLNARNNLDEGGDIWLEPRDADDGGAGETEDPGNPCESSTAARWSLEGLRYSSGYIDSRHSLSF